MTNYFIGVASGAVICWALLSTAYDQGVKAGRMLKQSDIEQAMHNVEKDLVSKVCYQWWFNTTGNKRKPK